MNQFHEAKCDLSSVSGLNDLQVCNYRMLPRQSSGSISVYSVAK